MIIPRGAVVRSTSALVLVACSVVAWLVIVLYATDMPGAPGTRGLGVLEFVGLWTVMMAAVMLPSISPLVALYFSRVRTELSVSAAVVRTTALVAGYLATWASFGVVAFALARAGDVLVTRSPDVAPWVGAGALVAVGLYQLTPLKDFSLTQCRSPISFLLHHGNVEGRGRDFKVGLRQGAFCISCCWGLVVVLVVGGIMSLGWMAGIAAAVLLEKTWRHGRALSIVLGLALVVLALFVPSNPELLPGLCQSLGTLQ